MLNDKNIEELREKLICELTAYKGTEKIKLNIKKEILDKILFQMINPKGIKHKEFAFDFKLMKKLDLSKVSFDNVNIIAENFTGSYGVKINPQTIYRRNMVEATLAGVTFIGSFDKVAINGADFTRSKNAFIDPQNIYNKKMFGTTLTDVTFTGSFYNVDIRHTDFTGSKGAVINPQTIYNKDMSYAILTDVTFTGSFDDVDIKCANFTGSKGAKINPQTIKNKCLNGTDITDVEITGSFNGVETKSVIYKGSIITEQNIDSLERLVETKDFDDVSNQIDEAFQKVLSKKTL